MGAVSEFVIQRLLASWRAGEVRVVRRGWIDIGVKLEMRVKGVDSRVQNRPRDPFAKRAERVLRGIHFHGADGTGDATADLEIGPNVVNRAEPREFNLGCRADRRGRGRGLATAGGARTSRRGVLAG